MPDSTTYDKLSAAHDLIERAAKLAWEALDAAIDADEEGAADGAVEDLRQAASRVNAACTQALSWPRER